MGSRSEQKMLKLSNPTQLGSIKNDKVMTRRLTLQARLLAKMAWKQTQAMGKEEKE